MMSTMQITLLSPHSVKYGAERRMVMAKTIPNDKEHRRNRRQRNLVAKNNRHKGGYHSSAKYVREKYVPGSWVWEI
jgi:hypothetical protein